MLELCRERMGMLQDQQSAEVCASPLWPLVWRPLEDLLSELLLACAGTHCLRDGGSLAAGPGRRFAGKPLVLGSQAPC